MAEVETTMEELSAIAKAMDSGKSLDEARATIAPPEAEPEKPEPENQADGAGCLAGSEGNGAKDAFLEIVERREGEASKAGR